MYNRIYTPEKITSLNKNEIFVFGSNIEGHHGGGAARFARKYFGAISGVGVGLQGQSYAIPTMHGGVDVIKPYVDQFVDFAQLHPEYTFFVTKIGCGIAGFTEQDIAPLFSEVLNLENVILPKKFVEIINNSKPVYNIDRFLNAQQKPLCGYEDALNEIKSGKKREHWIWYTFPQLRCLGRSKRSHFYGIANKTEAEIYLSHPILSTRLREITNALLQHKNKSSLEIFGGIDSVKVCSCMTLFDFISPNDVFAKVLHTFYNDKRCESTLKVLQEE